MLRNGPFPALIIRVTIRVIANVSTNAAQGEQQRELAGLDDVLLEPVTHATSVPRQSGIVAACMCPLRPIRHWLPHRLACAPVTSLDTSHGLRFAFGTLTVLPVRVTRWDRGTARAGMLCAPLAGLVVGRARRGRRRAVAAGAGRGRCSRRSPPPPYPPR